MTNTKLLEQLIEESGLKRDFIAQKLGLTRQGLRLKIIGEQEFTQTEIYTLCDLLRIKQAKKKEAVFFYTDVDKTSTRKEG